MRKNKFIFEKFGLKVFEIELNNGKIYKNYPNRGGNLHTLESVEEFLVENESYFLTLGNNRRVTVYRNDVKEIR
ncbi:hypothetical protein [Paenibacillus pini]|uniref:Uncharacterized protein n=1 Tax=Paenibacillus pini JCM 16418 TaxID=1236976 RepID=W7YIU1_9BACL|nr:hypothetical protein [Paenibacillus pini]GAF10815.1 hypothetical protein JCM16418_5038 [Paenibacillus pini JCM 16418]